MKKIMFVFVAILMLAGCSSGTEPKQTVNEDESENTMGDTLEAELETDEEEDEIETVFEKDTDLALVDNEVLKINLLKVAQGRSDQTDHVALKVEIENKQNKTFEFYIKNLKVDGIEIDPIHLSMDEIEIKPNETKDVFINGYEYDELSIEEHISGRIVLNDFEGNRQEVEFNEYINE